MYDLYKKLNEAYGASTRKFNAFADRISKIKWDEKFYADGEYYFIKNDLTLVCENLDPFKERWSPALMSDSGTVFELGLLSRG